MQVQEFEVVSKGERAMHYSGLHFYSKTMSSVMISTDLHACHNMQSLEVWMEVQSTVVPYSFSLFALHNCYTNRALYEWNKHVRMNCQHGHDHRSKFYHRACSYSSILLPFHPGWFVTLCFSLLHLGYTFCLISCSLWSPHSTQHCTCFTECATGGACSCQQFTIITHKGKMLNDAVE